MKTSSRRSVTQRLFLNVSELQVRVDGVGATLRHRDAVEVPVRATPSTWPRRCRSTQKKARWPQEQPNVDEHGNAS